MRYEQCSLIRLVVIKTMHDLDSCISFPCPRRPYYHGQAVLDPRHDSPHLHQQIPSTFLTYTLLSTIWSCVLILEGERGRGVPYVP